MNSNPIGIFDSGIGGLTVVREVMKALPGESIVYFGDTARVPYGSKSRETVTKFSVQIMNFLLSHKAKAIVIACNTVCSNSFDELTKLYSLPIIEVVRPGALLGLKHAKNNRIGIIGTEATIRSGAYERVIKEMCPTATVFSKACPLFVPIAEERWNISHNPEITSKICELAAEAYLPELLFKKIDSLVLGCTHYPLLIDSLRKITGDVTIVNPAEEVAIQMKSYLKDNNLCNTGNVTHKFFASDNAEKFEQICSNILGDTFKTKKIDIENY